MADKSSNQSEDEKHKDPGFLSKQIPNDQENHNFENSRIQELELIIEEISDKNEKELVTVKMKKWLNLNIINNI